MLSTPMEDFLDLEITNDLWTDCVPWRDNMDPT